jgi:hypothetical protein
MALLDPSDYISSLQQERHRAIILHIDAQRSPALTEFCRRLCERTGGKYVDLLDLFVQEPDLNGRIDRFGPEDLRDLIVQMSRDCSLVVVDRADFLLDTWSRPQRQNLFKLIADQWDGYKQSTRARLIFALQSSLEVEALRIMDSRGRSRVLRLTDFREIA